MTKQTTIDERIASALNSDPVSAATITALLRDAEAALEKHRTSPLPNTRTHSTSVAQIQTKRSSRHALPH